MLNESQLDTIESEIRLRGQGEWFDDHELRALISQAREANRLRERCAKFDAELDRVMGDWDRKVRADFDAKDAEITRLRYVAEAAVALCEHTKELPDTRCHPHPQSALEDWSDKRQDLIVALHSSVARLAVSPPLSADAGEGEE